MASIIEELAFWRLRRMGLARTAHHLLKNTSRLLPAMPPEEVQKAWTGSAGVPLLEQSMGFIEVMAAGYARIAGRPLRGATVLDYGCGWGRLMRLMYAHIPPSRLYGCDPWSDSIELCRSHGVRGHLALSDYLPKSLPFGDTQFDLIYAYSVFTHLSERTCNTVLAALRQRIKPNGLLCITVRPGAYWRAHSSDEAVRAAMSTSHRYKGFAFVAHDRAAIDGEITYGDTSISLDYMRTHWVEWEIVETGVISDEYQLVIFLRPK
jgi:2-polyprenyl-3-methyl-5-hydroxy-6-metoxy-1,4-benzoquinol methylase